MLGIGVTTRNRELCLNMCVSAIKLYTHCSFKLVVVDDASEITPVLATHKFVKNLGVACSKNLCLSLLRDCNEIFLFDDDCFPMKRGWNELYTKASYTSGNRHLCYGFGDAYTNTKVTRKDGEVVVRNNGQGCMMYFRDECLADVGGFNESYGKYGYEHGGLSNRIHNACLNPSGVFVDAFFSDHYIHSMDEKDCEWHKSGNLVDDSLIEMYQNEIKSREFMPFQHELKPYSDLIVNLTKL